MAKVNLLPTAGKGSTGILLKPFGFTETETIAIPGKATVYKSIAVPAGVNVQYQLWLHYFGRLPDPYNGPGDEYMGYWSFWRDKNGDLNFSAGTFGQPEPAFDQRDFTNPNNGIDFPDANTVRIALESVNAADGSICAFCALIPCQSPIDLEPAV